MREDIVQRIKSRIKKGKNIADKCPFGKYCKRHFENDNSGEKGIVITRVDEMKENDIINLHSEIIYSDEKRMECFTECKDIKCKYFNRWVSEYEEKTMLLIYLNT